MTFRAVTDNPGRATQDGGRKPVSDMMVASAIAEPWSYGLWAPMPLINPPFAISIAASLPRSMVVIGTSSPLVRSVVSARIAGSSQTAKRPCRRGVESRIPATAPST